MSDPERTGFDQPWQAHVMALADTLIREGHLDGKAWAIRLGQELRAAEAAGAPDTTETCYTCVLTTLEAMTEEHVSPHDRQKRRAAWEDAYVHTPHGQPVRLKPSDG